ncbi:MAG: signal peptidase I [Treponema sp.]|nr:signal peptidase I [Treponema sp.]
MFNKSIQYSYAAQKHQRHRLLKFLLSFLILFIVYNCLTAFLVSVWVIDNETMQPGLNSGDRLLVLSFALSDSKNNLPFKRGSIVLVNRMNERDRKLPLRIADGIVRFFTAQRVSVFSGDGQHIKRVIALPGDEISMTDYIFRVKAGANPFSLTEFELSDKPYNPYIPQTSALWDSSIPFSGSMDPVILGPNECFVVSDDRSNTNDSRTWGPISPSMISARVILRFWPLNKIELF